jgi:hypothetical protein
VDSWSGYAEDEDRDVSLRLVKKEKGMQAKLSHRSRGPHTLSGLDKPIPSGFALSVTPCSASFFPPYTNLRSNRYSSNEDHTPWNGDIHINWNADWY